jgi:hypothetical protein
MYYKSARQGALVAAILLAHAATGLVGARNVLLPSPGPWVAPGGLAYSD